MLIKKIPLQLLYSTNIKWFFAFVFIVFFGLHFWQQKLIANLNDIPSVNPIDGLNQLEQRLISILPSNPPLVSVIIPCYNYGDMVKRAVNSVIQQNYPSFEILVVDDGSFDKDTIRALEDLKSIPSVEVLHKENSGLSATRNYGVSFSSGKYLLFLDNDDLLEKSALSLLVLELENNNDAAYAYPHQWFFGTVSIVWETQPFNYYDLIWANHPTVCSLIRKSAFEAIHGYSMIMEHGMEDWFFWMTLGDAGFYGTSVPVPLFKYYRHGKTMQHSSEEKASEIRTAIFDMKRRVYTPSRIKEIKELWRPLVTIIVPFYNAVDTIEETLDSLILQTTEDFTVLIIDDKSPEEKSKQWLENFEKSRFAEYGMKLIRNEKNLHVSATRNYGALRARSDFVIFLDADDILQPTYIEKLALIFGTLSKDEREKTAFVYTSVEHFGTLNATATDVYSKERLLKENFLVVTCMLDRRMYLQAGGFDEGYDKFEDWDLWLRFASLGKQGKIIEEPLFRYRRHKKGRTGENDKFEMEDMIADLRGRNPIAFGDSLSEFLASYRPRAEFIEAGISDHSGKFPSEPHDTLINSFRQSYKQNLGISMPYDSFRRNNFLLPFHPKHWERMPDVIHVLYLIPFMVVGGAEKVDIQILEALKETTKSKFFITLVVEQPASNLWQKEFEKNVDEIFFLHTMSDDPEKHIVILEYLLISRSIDVVFNRNTYCGYKAFDKWHGKFTQIKLVDLMHLYEPNGGAWERESAPFHKKIDVRNVISLDYVDYIEKQHKLPREDFTVIYCGIDFTQFNLDNIQKGKLRQELSLGNEVPIVVSLNRLAPQKDPLLWLQVAEKILKSHPEVHFVMIGDGELKESVEISVQQSDLLRNRTHLLGTRNDVKELVIDVDVVLMTSVFEGIPLALMEAMALGKPIVAPDVGGIREAVNRKTGHLIDAEKREKPTYYANSVISLLNESPEKKKQREIDCVEFVHRVFDLQKMKDTYVNQFIQLTSFLDREQRLLEYTHHLFEKPADVTGTQKEGNSVNIKKPAGRVLPISMEMPQILTPTEVIWENKITLVAYSAPEKFVLGAPNTLKFVWKAGKPTTISFLIFVHLRNDLNKVVSQADDYPKTNNIPVTTNTWIEKEIIQDSHVLLVPKNLPSGIYKIIIGLYYVNKEGEGLNFPIESGQGSNNLEYTLTTFSVVNPADAINIQTKQMNTKWRASSDPKAENTAGVNLIQYSTVKEAYQGKGFSVTFSWECLSTIPQDLIIFVHLRDSNNKILIQADGKPKNSDEIQFETNKWSPTQKIQDRHTFWVPEDLSPNKYDIWIGLLYIDPSSKVAYRIPLVDTVPDSEINIGSVEIKQQKDAS